MKNKTIIVNLEKNGNQTHRNELTEINNQFKSNMKR